MNADTKRHIDSARQVLVGVVPNPASQIDQITNALIYKFMDDMDQAAIKAGGEPSFFVGSLKDYAWTRLMDSKIGNQQRMNMYSEALVKFSEAKQLPELFRGIFKSAYLPYRSPEVLDLFLKEINYFDYSHSEELGNAYEYLLSIMSSQGDAGQFRTPRHIIDFIVEVVNPTKDDKVLDPACGTAGFLISAYKHILSQHDGKNADGTKNSEKPLTPDQRKALVSNFEGYDIDPGMVRISQVNMYLHQFKNPKIYQYDSLSSDERWGDKFDVILANPPFMSPKGGIKPHSKFSIDSNRSEVLFVDYIMNHLRPKGRAGIIVPEGIIFQSGKSHTQLRKKLVEDGLYAVVSLPSGVFNPYSGVKTSILFFDNELAKQKKEILFIKIGNDGFDLGAQRRSNDKSNLPEAVEILSKWRNDKKVKSSLASYVERIKIAENGDYNLSMGRYDEVVDYSQSKWPMVNLEDVCEIESGSRQKGGAIDRGVYSIGGEQISKNNTIRFEKMKYITEVHFSEMKKGILFKGDVLMVKDGATTGKMGFWDFDLKAAVNEHVFIFRAKKDLIKPEILFALLRSDNFQESLRPYIKGIIGGISLEIKKLQIPLLSLEIQNQIVEELDGYQKIIFGARQVVENWKPRVDIDPKWEKVRLGDVCDTTSGGTPLKSKDEYYKNGDIPWLRSGEVAQGFVTKSELFITKEGLKKSSAKLFPVDTVLVAMYGATAGQVGLLKFESSTNQAICGVLPNKKFIPEFLYQLLKDQREIMVKLAGGGAQPNISQTVIKNLELATPSIEKQRQIVERIKLEQLLVESNKKLIDIYEQKIKEVIAKLWEK